MNAQIFEVHQMMLEDEDYQDAIHSMIETEELNAEYAVAVTGDNFAEIFANMDDEYMQARSADVKDISNRLIRNLSGEEELDWAHMEPYAGDSAPDRDGRHQTQDRYQPGKGNPGAAHRKQRGHEAYGRGREA